MPEQDSDQVELVRRGYDVLSERYRADDAPAGGYGPWLAELQAELGGARRVLDVGCGCGVPVARDLAAAGYDVVGLDVSEVQVERARRLVPTATFVRADATRVALPPESFDAVVALYSLIHVPLAAQPVLLTSFARWLAPGGVLLLTAGWDAWTGSDPHWLGGDTPMWWSQGDAATYRTWLRQAGFEVLREELVPEGTSGHALFLARRGSG